MNQSTNWTRWPHPVASVDPQVMEEQSKTAAPLLDYSEPSPELIVGSIRVDLPDWMAELPSGIEKVAAKRLGTDDDLPVVTTKNIWRHPNAHPLVLSLLLMDRYGQDYIDWEPEALRLTLRKDDILLSESVWTKILAMRVLLSSPAPWRQWEQFHWISLGLAGRAPNFKFMEKPQLGFLMSAIDTMRHVDRPRPFSEDIGKFIAASCRDAGIAYCPSPFQFVQEELDDPHIKCEDCGTLERDDHDVKCVACGSKKLKHLPPEFADLRDQTKALFEARKKMRLEQAVDGLGEDAAGSAAYKLLTHNEYRNQVRAQLISQLRMLKSQ
jgi:hypothetical protein